MIVKNITEGIPESLTGEEVKSLILNRETSRLNNGSTITIYQGDEPPTPIDIISIKFQMTEAIDRNTSEVISQGFTYDGKVFSLSDAAQKNITNVAIMPESEFPIIYVTKDDSDFINLTYEDRMNFYLAAVNAVKSIRVSNGQRKLQVMACQTIEELNQLNL